MGVVGGGEFILGLWLLVVGRIQEVVASVRLVLMLKDT